MSQESLSRKQVEEAVLAKFYAYIHARPNGMPFYIGKSQDLMRPYTMKRNKHHNNIVKKYGAHNIKVRIIRCVDEAHAFAIEIQIIKDLRAMGIPLTNMTDGGEGIGGMTHSTETRAKISAAHKGRRITDPTILGNMAAARRGKKHTAEHCAKISAAGRLRTQSASTRAKVSAAHTGRVHTAESVANMSAGHKGKVHSAEQRAKISASLLGYFAARRALTEEESK